MRRDVDEITRALRQLAPSDSFNSEIANAGSAGHVRMAMPVLTSQSDLNAVLNFFANQNIPVTTHQVLGANRISTLGSSKVGEAPNSFAQAQKVFDAINQLQAGAVATQPIDGPVQRFVVSMSAHMDNYIPAHLQALIDGEPVHIPLSQSVPPVQQTTPAGLGTVNATEASQIRDVISKMNGNPAELKAADAAQIKQLRDRLNSAESLSPAEREISKLVNQAWNLVGETYQKQLNNDPGLALAKAQGRGVEADFVAAQDVGLVKPSSELKTAIQDAMAALDIVSGAGPQQLVNREIQGLIANGNMRFSMPALQTQEEVTAVRDFFASHGMTVDDKVILAANRLSMLATMRIEDAKNSFQDAQPLFKVMQTLPSHEIAKISATSPEGQLIQNMLVHLNHHIATDVQKQVASATGGTGAADATVVHSSPAFEGEDRRSNAGLEPQFERMSEVQMPGLPEGLKVYENRAANGEKFLTFQYVVQVEGQLKVKESILPIDPLTQMIDATLPSGKKFAELWITANGGQAHAIFADVGNLGFVNKEMAGQREAGDAYLTSTANMIRAVTGENSVSFKWGGDELVTFTTEKDSMKVQAMAQAISDGVHAPDIHKIFLDEKKVRAEAVRAEIYGKFPAADPRAYQTAVANAGSEEEKAKLTAEHKQARALMASSGIFDIYKSFPAAKPETYRMAMAEIGKRELAMTPDERAQNAANLAQERTELTEKFERAQAEMRSSSLYMSRTATTDFKEKFVPYSRETISVGVTAIGVGDSKENVLLRSEGQATLVKREVKEHMNQDASKYLGSEPSADRKIESTWEPTILMPSSAPATDAAPTGLRAVTPDLPLVTEERIGQIGRFDRFDVGVYQDEIGNISYKLEDYLTDASGKRQVVHYEVPLNGNTGFMDANNVHAERVLRAVVEEQAPQGLVMLDAWILQKVNYFAAGTGAGDLFLESVGKAISSVLEKENLPFKLAGPKFLLEVGQTNLTAFENSVEKALENSAEIKQMFADQRAYLEAMLETNPNDKELQGHLRTLNDLETHSLVLISSLRTETGNRLEDVKKKMSDDISAQEKVAKAEATARLLQAANQAEAGEETPPKKAAGD